MTIKHYVFNVHAHLSAQDAPPLGRSQVHELLAAAAGFSTHAAFLHQAAWCDLTWRDTGLTPDVDLVIQRCLHFGMPLGEAELTARNLVAFLASSGLAPVGFEELSAALTGDGDQWAEAGVAGWVSSLLASRMQHGVDVLLDAFPLLLDGLEAGAARGLAAAHWAAACMLEPYSGVSVEDDRRFGRELRRRHQWSASSIGFRDLAESGDRFVQVVAKHRYHLLAAARGGDRRAMLVTAARYGDPGALDLAPSDDMEPYEMVDLADMHGRADLAYQWLTVLAREGDVSAMRDLIEHRGETRFRAWVWMHLSRLLGHDLGQDRHEAIHEDGSPYDDDVGGPAYVGGFDAIELPPLETREDRRARQVAARLFAWIKSAWIKEVDEQT